PNCWRMLVQSLNSTAAPSASPAAPASRQPRIRSSRSISVTSSLNLSHAAVSVQHCQLFCWLSRYVAKNDTSRVFTCTGKVFRQMHPYLQQLTHCRVDEQTSILQRLPAPQRLS